MVVQTGQKCAQGYPSLDVHVSWIKRRRTPTRIGSAAFWLTFCRLPGGSPRASPGKARLRSQSRGVAQKISGSPNAEWLDSGCCKEHVELSAGNWKICPPASQVYYCSAYSDSIEQLGTSRDSPVPCRQPGFTAFFPSLGFSTWRIAFRPDKSPTSRLAMSTR